MAITCVGAIPVVPRLAIVASVLAHEPGHPQQMVLLLLMFGSRLSVPSTSSQSVFLLFVLGSVGSALVFTKVNMGVFYTAGLTHTLFCLLARSRIRSTGIALALLYAGFAPWLLMHSDLEHGVLGYCLLATLCGTVTFFCGSLLHPDPPLSFRSVLYAGAGLLMTIVLIVIATSLQGLSVPVLVQGFLIDAMKQPDLFFVPLQVSGRTLMAAAVVSGCLISMWLFRRHLASHTAWINGIRCLVGAGAALILISPSEAGSVPRIEWVAPFLPLALWPVTRKSFSAAELFPLLFITDLSVTQFLQAYPVSGSQVGIAASPMLLWAFVCMVDGIEGLTTAWGRDANLIVSKLRLDSILGSIMMLGLAGEVFVSALVPFRHFSPRHG